MRNSLLFILIASLWGIMMIFVGCDDTKEFEDLNVTAVEALIVPIDNSRIDLQSSGNVLFEWEEAEAQDGYSLVYYDVLFDKAEGNFSSPVHIQASDNKSLSTGATITPTVAPPTIFHTVVHLHEMYISSNMRCTFQTTRDVHLMQVERIVQANVFHWFTNLNLLQARQKISFISR